MDHDNTLPPLPGDAQHPENALQMPVPLHFPPPPPPNPQAGLPVRSDSSHVSVVANAPLRTPIEKSPFEDADTLSARGSTPPDRREGGSIPAQSTREGAPSRRPRTVDTHMSTRRSGLDWIIPMEEKKEPPLPPRQSTVGERLQPTIDVADLERVKYAAKAKFSGYALNAAIGLQVALGALTTGLSAVTSGRQTSIAVSVLGGLTTIVASYLARARGSNEPELSIARCKDLEQFLREARAFQLDKGHTQGDELDEALGSFRRRFEELLGNANGERRLAPV